MIRIPWGLLYVGAASYATITSSFSTFVVLSVAITALKILHATQLYPAFLTPIKHIPTPHRRSWLTGNSDTYVIQTPFEDIREWIKTVPNNGLLRYYVVGNMERVLVATPKALSELLVQGAYDFQKPAVMRRSLGRIAGKHGILLVEGQEHKRHRKNLMPAFSYRHIKDLYPTFWAKSVEMTRCIEKDLQARGSPDDNIVEIRPWASKATLDIIGLAGMDRDFGSLADPKNELAAQYHRVLQDPPLWLKLLFAASVVMGGAKLLQALPIQRNEDISEGSNYVRQVAQQLISDRRETIKHNPDESETGKDILSVALNSGMFTDEELIDQMMTFLAAGHETTSSALQWSIYALCKHPDVQERLREEIRASLPPISVGNPEPITAATLDSLPYLHAVCNEVLRFHPSVPITFREPPVDTMLSGTLVPKGTMLTICPEVINHHPDLWGPDADKFDPERWLGPGRANTGGASSNYALMTFLHGPRSCIGQGFAKAELACLVAATVGRFHMELADPNKKLEIKRSATASPLDGVLARLTPLEGW
ncbi:cytochrome P450 [Aspergillus karnatakaensis]|uniref:cytochrome P450 n=1 Tax=Aspergillus karnatakaensis TaxID=1810916 RepID=UPI003CCD80A0